MAKPVDLNKFKKSQRQQQAKGKTLCARGFHKWQFDEHKQFDVQQGKLVSIKKCSRCGTTRTHIK